MLNQHAKLARLLASRGLIGDVAILDIGCSGGIDPGLRQLEPHLKGVGVDPLIPEIKRLNAAEHNPKLSYVCAFAKSNRSYPDAEGKHSTNWFQRSQACYAMEPETDRIAQLIEDKS